MASNLLATFQTAVDYQITHSLALIAVALAAKSWQMSKPLEVAGWAFSAGITLFCGSLYALALTGQTVLGVITPLGGLCFLIGWASLTFFAISKAS